MFAKRVHRSLKHGARAESPRGTTRRDNSMPVEVAQVLYDLAGALALCRCGTRIIGLSDERYRKTSPGCSINRGLIPDSVRSSSTPSNSLDGTGPEPTTCDFGVDAGTRWQLSGNLRRSPANEG